MRIVGLVEWVYSALSAVQGWVFILSLLVFVPTICFRATRGFGANALYLASAFWFVLLWVEAFLYIVHSSGWFWIIWGLFLGIVGIVPIAWIMSMVRGDWLSAGLILGNLVWIYGTRFLAAYGGPREATAGHK
jgi:hypothetical protein